MAGETALVRTTLGRNLVKPRRLRTVAIRLALATAGAAGSLPAAAGAVALDKPTFSGAAVGVEGGGIRLAGTAGEAGVVGRSELAGLVLLEGFWHPGLGHVSAVGPDPQDPAAGGAAFANALAANHPNPFSGGTVLAFSVGRPAQVTLDIHDLAGRRVRRLVGQAMPAGRHDLRWDGRDDRGAPLASGLYHARLSIDDWTDTRRLLLVR